MNGKRPWWGPAAWALIFCFPTALRAADPAPWLARAAYLYDITEETDTEVEEYFTRIAQVRAGDASAAARDYNRFILKFGERPTVMDGIRVPVGTRVERIVAADPVLRAAYTAVFGPAAREACDAAVAARDLVRLETVGREQGITPAGAEALAFLAAYHLDHGDLGRTRRCMDRLAGLPDGDAHRERLTAALAGIMALAGRGPAPRPVVPADIDGHKPRWIAGVNVTTVYPDQVPARPPVLVGYELLLAGGGVYVNSGRDVYAYEAATGRHAWPPGDFHAVRMAGLFTGGMEPVLRGEGDPGRPFREEGGRRWTGASRFQDPVALAFPAGGLVRDRGRIAAVLNKREEGNLLVVFDSLTGAAVPVPMADDVAAYLRRQGRAVETGRPGEPGSLPAAAGGSLFVSFHTALPREELCQLVSYDLGWRSIQWMTEVCRARTRNRRDAVPGEGLVIIDGPYLALLAWCGYTAVFRAEDGGLVWGRSLLPADAVSPPGGAETVTCLPVAAGGRLIMEGPARGDLTGLVIDTGRTAWTTAVGDPRWLMPAGTGIIAAVAGDAGVKLVMIDPATGVVRWQYTGPLPDPSYPGCVAGDAFYIAVDDGLAVIGLADGRPAGTIVLAGGCLPGRVYLTDRVHIVNSAGIFTYAAR
ncbi:MAG: PQQ-binding-like beta-propeller repeat protein [Planctomycetota bacterium]